MIGLQKGRLQQIVSNLGLFNPNYKVIPAKGNDLITLLDDKKVSSILIGEDIVLENGLFDTEYCHTSAYNIIRYANMENCRLCIIGVKPTELIPSTTIFTRYPRTASKLFPNNKIVKINGCDEEFVAAYPGSVALDIVDTGNTLKDYNLSILQECKQLDILEISLK